MYEVHGSTRNIKVSDGEILVAGLMLGLMGLRATSADPLTTRLVGYMIDSLLLLAACIVLPSGRRMCTSGILIRTTILQFSARIHGATKATRRTRVAAAWPFDESFIVISF